MRVQLLGKFAVEVDGQAVDGSRWRLSKARTVVKLLALEPSQRLHREYLLDLLWPDLAPAAAANNLHQALHAARRALAGAGPDGLLELRDQVVVLRAGGPVEVDATRFRTLSEAALDGGEPARLREAHEAYRGELLPDDRYEPWARGRGTSCTPCTGGCWSRSGTGPGSTARWPRRRPRCSWPCAGTRCTSRRCGR